VRRAFVVTAILLFALPGSASASRISPADRQEINRTVDAFVNSAVKRQNEDASWNVVTPSFRYGVTRSAWAKGNLPVYPYPARGTTFHSWTVDSVSPTVVDFELMVPSRLSKTDSIQFQGEVKKIGGRWLINSFNPAATFAAGGTVVGPHLALLGQFFIGYDVTFRGSLIGLGWGAATGFVLGYAVSTLYNRVVAYRARRRAP